VVALLAMVSEVISKWERCIDTPPNALGSAASTLKAFEGRIDVRVFTERTDLELLEGETDAKDCDRAKVAIERMLARQ